MLWIMIAYERVLACGYLCVFFFFSPISGQNQQSCRVNAMIRDDDQRREIERECVHRGGGVDQIEYAPRDQTRTVEPRRTKGVCSLWTIW